MLGDLVRVTEPVRAGTAVPGVDLAFPITLMIPMLFVFGSAHA
jgi:hypothetical protein